MKKLKIIFAVVLIASFTTCTTKKSDESHADMEVEADATEALGADADILEGMNVYFVNIEDGATLTSPVSVEMGLNGMEVDPAGELALNKGHHHIIVDGGFNAKGIVVPADTTHLHFGLGQTSAELTLSPGPHTLTLQFADGFHRSYGEQMSAQVSIVVE